MDFIDILILLFRSTVALILTAFLVFFVGIIGFIHEMLIFVPALFVALLVFPRNVLKEYWPGTFPETWRIFFQNRKSQILYVGALFIGAANIFIGLRVLLSLILLLPASLFAQRLLYAHGKFLTYEDLEPGILTLIWRWAVSKDENDEIQ